MMYGLRGQSFRDARGCDEAVAPGRRPTSRRQGPDTLPFVESVRASTLPLGALTHGELRFPLYRSHCPVWNELAPVEWSGQPSSSLFDSPSREDGSCTLHIYTRHDGGPRAYPARLGIREGAR